MKIIRLISLAVFISLLVVPMFVEAEKPAGKIATVYQGKKSQKIYARASTVGAALRRNGVKIDRYRVVFPAPESDYVEGMHIFLHSSGEQNKKETWSEENNHSDVRTINTWALPSTKKLVIQGGSSHSTQSSPRVILDGQAEFKVDQLNQLTKKGTLRVLATAYSPHHLDTAPYTDGLSAIGIPAGYGLVAVDPRVIPLGTLLYVEGYGYGLAADVGGKIEGKKVDLCFPDRKDALLFGRQWTTIHILG